ncbi:hypothetical protein DYBT9623_00008 [Dyadobacter sp. CECT 9623]|uniref:PIN domain-containing protein n=1 Tax=Dyadobacter linearis TaxID=2823330 RepID=A0ABM8UIS8_9BACT|nr:putative toxin-antitoxin system toxin component, PIN family [Dyadobacter sp. CECT 9623]CAG5067288.1 hypothetical protein DYBT9623_00008 [Dyadobacter sp. CECT 9623]
MQKIVIDTNVIVSALIQRSYPHLIIYDLFVEGQFQLCLSDDLLAEYFEVLARQKFSRFPDFFVRAESLLANIASQGKMYIPSTKIAHFRQG